MKSLRDIWAVSLLIVGCVTLMALVNLVFGFLWCVTIVGIPFGKQFFKIAKLALTPFGARVV